MCVTVVLLLDTHRAAIKSACMKRLPVLFFAAFSFIASAVVSSAADAIPATRADGRVLNLGFEDGTLRDWTATGNAFEKQPVKGEIDQARPNGKGRVSNRKRSEERV